MKKFEIGKEYFDTSACDHNCIFTIRIVKRTEKNRDFRAGRRNPPGKAVQRRTGRIYHS